MELVPEIERYFKTHEISFLRVKNNKKRPYMSIIRSILKYCKYNIIIQSISIKDKENPRTVIRTQKYDIFKGE